MGKTCTGVDNTTLSSNGMIPKDCCSISVNFNTTVDLELVIPFVFATNENLNTGRNDRFGIYYKKSIEDDTKWKNAAFFVESDGGLIFCLNE